MKQLHVVGNIGNAASGPSYSVVELARALGRRGNPAVLMSIDDTTITASPGMTHRGFARGRWPVAVGGSTALSKTLGAAARATDLLHVHGLWAFANVYPRAASRRAGRPLVVSPRGTLSQWALDHHRWRKRVFWMLFQRGTCRDAAMFHATCEAECEDIRRAGFTQPVAVIANGIHLPDAPPPKMERPERTLLFLGRLHPVKGTDRLIEAWAQVYREFPAWKLRLVGPDELGTRAALQASAKALGAERVEFGAPAFGGDKDRAYREADLYVLPTRSENFGITVAEALANGTPAIVTKGAPWAGLASEGAGWWIDHGVEPLVAALRAALTMTPAQLGAMGARGREWMARDFAWDGIALQMEQAYAWMLGGGEQPACIRNER